MKHAAQKSGYVAIASLGFLLLASSPLVAATEANLYLNSAGSGTVLAGIYTSPYTAQITPGSSYNGGSPTVNVICDDFYDNTYVPEDWNTYVTTLSSLTSESSPNLNVYFGQSGDVTVSGPGVTTTTLTQAQAYEVAAVLAVDIDFGSAAGSTAQQDYSYAMWQLFDPAGSNAPYGSGAIGWLQTYTGYDSNAAAQAAAVPVVEQDLNAAVSAVTGGTAGAVLSSYNVAVYSYIPNSGVTDCGGCQGPPQEFITVSAAEPPPLAESAVYFALGAGCLLFFGRRRIFRTDS
jgi:hypothetical protein